MKSIAKLLLSGVLVVTAMPSGGVSEDFSTGVDLFIDACRRQGINPAMIRTGYGEIDMSVVTHPMSEEQVQEEIDRRTQDHRDLIAKATDPHVKSLLEKAILQIPEAVRTQNTGTRRSRIKVLFDGNDVTFGKRRWEVINLDSATQKWNQPIAALRRGLSAQEDDNVLWENSAHLAVVSSIPGGAPVEFQTLGRMQGLPAKFATSILLDGADPLLFEFTPSGVADLKSQLTRMEESGKVALLRLAGEADYDEGAVAYVVESRIQTDSGSQLALRYWIDVSRDYVCPLLQFFDDEGNVTEEWKSSNYFLHEKSGLWFPALTAHTEHANEPSLREQTTYQLDAKTLQINQPIADAEFTIQIPEGASVRDLRGGKETHYRAGSPATLSLAEKGLQLDAMPELGGLRSAMQESPPPSSRIPGIAGLVVVIFALTVLFVWRQKQRRIVRLACWWLCTLFVAVGQGCSRASPSERPAAPSIVVEPAVLDFGRIREQGEPLELHCSVANTGDRSVEILSVKSGCGCTVVDLSKSVLTPHDCMPLSIKVNLHGRLGQFSNEIRIRVSARNDPIVVPLRGIIVQDIWYNGQAIRCSLGGAASTAENTFEVSTVDWPSVTFDWNALCEGMSVQELSRTKKGAETVIQFHLSMVVPADEYVTSRQVILKPTDERIRPLMIPVVCYRPAIREGETAIVPSRVSLGVLHQGEERQFQVRGAGPLLRSLSIVGVERIPQGVRFEMAPINPDAEDSREMTIYVDRSVPSGLLNGRVRLEAPDGRKCSIAVLGMVRERNRDTSSRKAKQISKAGAEPERQSALF